MANFTDTQLAAFEKQEIECVDVMLLLGDLHDHDMPSCLEERLLDHIATCPECQELRRGYELVINLAHQIDEEPLPDDVEDRLHQALNKRLGLHLK